MANDVVTVAWNELPDLSDLDEAEIQQLCSNTYQAEKEEAIRVYARELWDFVGKIQIGDRVVLPRLSDNRNIWVAEVLSGYSYSELAADVKHIRHVRWLAQIPRSAFRPDLESYLNVPLTVYELNPEAVNEIERQLRSENYPLLPTVKNLILAYARVAKSVADGDLQSPHIKFKHEIEAADEIQTRFARFIHDPTDENFKSFWKKEYIWAAGNRGSNATTLLNKTGLSTISNVLNKINDAEKYDPEWEKQIGAINSLTEFWGKLKGQAIKNGCSNNALALFGYGKDASGSYQSFLKVFEQFAHAYSQILGQEKVTPYPLAVELDQFFNFVDKARPKDIAEFDVTDERVRALYQALEKMIGPQTYWIEMSYAKNRLPEEETEGTRNALWSPQHSKPNKAGTVSKIYENMRRVKPGDVVVHLTDAKEFDGISLVANTVDDTFICPQQSEWTGAPGYLVALSEYEALSPPIKREALLNAKANKELLLHVLDKYQRVEAYKGGLFFRKDLNLNQGKYLTRCPPEVMSLLNGIYRESARHDLPHLRIDSTEDELIKDFIVAYSRVAKRVADGTLTCPYVDFGRDAAVREEVRQRFNAFLNDPSDETLKQLWDTKCLRLAQSGNSLADLRKKHEIDAIHRVFQQLADGNQYDPMWEGLSVPWALRELWAKLNGVAVCDYENWLVFFGYERCHTYQEALDRFVEFANSYTNALGGQRATQYPIEVETGGLLNFVLNASSCDLDQCDAKRQFTGLEDEDIQRLYSLKLQIDTKHMVKVLASEEYVSQYLKARYSRDEDKWDEAYKWERLDTLHNELLDTELTSDNIATRLDILRKNNESGHAFAGWAGVYDLQKGAEKNPALVVELLKNFFAKPEPLHSSINTFRQNFAEIDGKGLAPGLFGYLLAIHDKTRYPPFNYSIYTTIKTTNEKLRPRSLLTSYSRELERWEALSTGMKYERYCDLCNEMGRLLEEQGVLRDMTIGETFVPKGVLALDGQDYFYFLRNSIGGADGEHNSWIFQANMKAFRRQNADGSWVIKRYVDRVKVDDKVFYWKAGDNAGLYGTGHIAAQPEEKTQDEYDVETLVDDFFDSAFISKARFLEDPILKSSLIIKQPQGTIFPLKEGEVQAIERLISPGRVQFSAPKNLILYGPPGTGKTYQTVDKALAIVYEDSHYCDTLSREERVKEFNKLIQEERIQFITFHQSYSYEDFVEGIRPQVDEERRVYYQVVDGIFKKISARALENSGNHVLIIDEINRGNIPKIFGELITLIEDDKRYGGENQIPVQLPYSKKPFHVPRNLYIIGTMNSTDRSITLLDVALRRRFEFDELVPQYKETKLDSCIIDGLDVGRLLRRLNARIEMLLDRDHRVGHAYFCVLVKAAQRGQPLEELQRITHEIWYKNVVPLLIEYFYNDWEKLTFLLGSFESGGFVQPRGGTQEFQGYLGKDFIENEQFGEYDKDSVKEIHEYTPAALLEALKAYAE